MKVRGWIADLFFDAMLVEKNLKIEAVCAENIVKTMVFVSFHFFIKYVCFLIVGSLLVVILGGFGDLWRPFCVF